MQSFFKIAAHTQGAAVKYTELRAFAMEFSRDRMERPGEFKAIAVEVKKVSHAMIARLRSYYEKQGVALPSLPDCEC